MFFKRGNIFRLERLPVSLNILFSHSLSLRNQGQVVYETSQKIVLFLPKDTVVKPGSNYFFTYRTQSTFLIGNFYRNSRFGETLCNLKMSSRSETISFCFYFDVVTDTTKFRPSLSGGKSRRFSYSTLYSEKGVFIGIFAGFPWIFF
jgi:hypothetical protein